MGYNPAMRFREPLNELFRTPTRVKILRFLICHGGIPFTGREIARNLGLAHSNVAMALSRLRKMGVIRSMVKGRSILYQLNPRHILIAKVRPLLETEKDFLKLVLEELPVDWPSRTRSVILYGSVARGEEQSASDVDLCLVARSQAGEKRLEAELETLQAEFYLRTGNRFSPLVLTASRWVELYRKSDRLIRQIAREGKVLRGESIAELLT